MDPEKHLSFMHSYVQAAVLYKSGTLLQKILLIRHYVVGEAIKDTQHYFSHCRIYQGLFDTCLNACVTNQNPSLNLLFGSATLSLKTIVTIFEQVNIYLLHVIKHHSKKTYTYKLCI